ncbi:efflux RND transporter periplasmic adaptor subunit [Polycyclovorans algicola]|uniref:efflux RND transporter periplasmic adaptor subunit n=1 Tax=Polycyclovorans algicola TaxID=616992 RepID=UPI0004A6BD6C|nr:efflux RND transporter periplasmic adaptor subunit [Polycyclovorans algicola]
MNRTLFLAPWLMLALTLSACQPGDHHAEDDGHGHGETAHDDEMVKGPNGGRLLEDGDFALELAIVEDGVPPEYRAWATFDGETLAPEDVTLTVELSRLDGETNLFRFVPQEGALHGDGVVTEPHSFDVVVRAEYADQAYEWTYESHEGRVKISDASAQAAGIELAEAGPRMIREVLPLYGQIVVNPEAVREVGARFPGAVVSVTKSVGDAVQAGEVLARVESNESLQVYAVTSPISGTVTARRANPGEQAGAAALFTVSDLTQVWAELRVFPRDLARIRLGQAVRLSAMDGEQSTRGTVARISPNADSGGALKVWARFDGDAGGWTPGLYVNAEVLTGGAEVPLAVKTSGLQAFRDFTVVFTRVDETYEVRMLELGRSDGEYVEVLGGLKPGAPYVSENSYLIKADIEKSGASHDH